MLGLSGWARAQDAQVPEEARAHFKVGLSYLDDPAGPRYEDALREFAAARAAAPSSWKTLNNIGLCALNLERDQEAIDAYRQALALAGTEGDSKWREQVERDLATLKAGLVRVTIKVRPAGATLLDERVPTSGRPVLNRYESSSGSFELGIHAGHHRLSAILGSKSDAWEFDAEAGAVLSHEFVLEAPAPIAPPPSAAPPATSVAEPRPILLEKRTPPGVYVAAAATGILAVGAGVTGYLAVGKNDDFHDQKGENPERASSLRESGKTVGGGHRRVDRCRGAGRRRHRLSLHHEADCLAGATGRATHRRAECGTRERLGDGERQVLKGRSRDVR
jgi:hypothetical protein